MAEDPYTVLGFPDDREKASITEAEIRDAYKAMAAKQHPDNLGGSNYSGGADIEGIEAATARMKNINAAYRALTKEKDKKCDGVVQNAPDPVRVLKIDKDMEGDIYHEGPIEIYKSVRGNVTSNGGPVFVAHTGKLCGNIKVTGGPNAWSYPDVSVEGISYREYMD